MATLLTGVGSVALAIFLASVGQRLFHRYVPLEVRERQNDVAGFIYAVLGTSYGIIMAFVVVFVWQNFLNARQYVEAEANEVAGILDLARDLPDGAGDRIYTLAHEYLRAVVDDEWRAMNAGHFSPRARRLADELRQEIGRFEPRSSREQMLYDHLLDRQHGMEDARRLRLLQLQQSVPPILWVVLIGGGVITVSFTWLFGLSSTRGHFLMLAALTALIAGILFMIQATDLPFNGDVGVPPDGFQTVLDRYGPR